MRVTLAVAMAVGVALLAGATVVASPGALARPTACAATCASHAATFSGSATFHVDRAADAYGVPGTQESQTVSLTWTESWNPAAPQNSDPWTITSLSGSYQDSGTYPNGSSFSCSAALVAGGDAANGAIVASSGTTTVSGEVPFGETKVASVGSVSGNDPYCGPGGNLSDLGGYTPEWAQWVPPTEDREGGALWPKADFTSSGGSSQTTQGSYSCDDASACGGVTASVAVSSTFTFNKGPYVALGDSYSAADGAVPAGATEKTAYGDHCHRTPEAYPELVGLKVDDLACSGAKIATIELVQLPSIPSDASLVTVTAGGNDVQLFARTKECFLTPLGRLVQLRSLLHRHGCGAKLLKETDSELAGMPQRLAKLYSAIHRRAPDAELVVLGYPNPFPVKAGACHPRAQGSAFHLPLSLLAKLYREDIPPFQKIIVKLDQAVAKGVELAATGDWSPKFVATNGTNAPDSFDGHDICSSSPWIWGLRASPYPISSSLHPNIAGNRALATAVRTIANS